MFSYFYIMKSFYSKKTCTMTWNWTFSNYVYATSFDYHLHHQICIAYRIKYCRVYGLKAYLKDFWFYTQNPLLVHKTQRYKYFMNQDKLLRTNGPCKSQPTMISLVSLHCRSLNNSPLTVYDKAMDKRKRATLPCPRASDLDSTFVAMYQKRRIIKESAYTECTAVTSLTLDSVLKGVVDKLN